MPTIRRVIAAATENALTNLRFTRPNRPTLVSLYLAGATAKETASFGVDDVILMESAFVNVEVSADVIDAQRDQVLFREPCPAGEYVLAYPTVAAEQQFMLVQEVV